jgi:hypothetical protein
LKTVNQQVIKTLVLQLFYCVLIQVFRATATFAILSHRERPKLNLEAAITTQKEGTLNVADTVGKQIMMNAVGLGGSSIAHLPDGSMLCIEARPDRVPVQPRLGAPVNYNDPPPPPPVAKS